MKRRQFITLIGGAAAWPLAAHAQGPVPTVGFLRSTTEKGSEYLVTAFRQGLRQAGYVEGRNVAIDFHWGDDKRERLAELAADLVRRQVSLIVANTPAAVAAKRTTTTIPIVFVSGDDPIQTGLVTSLNRPGGNVTGLSFIDVSLTEKRFALLHELIAKAGPIAILVDPNAGGAEEQLRDAQAASRVLGRQLVALKAGTERELESAFAEMARQNAAAVHVGTGPFFNQQREQLVALAERHGLVDSVAQREAAEAGGVMSYSSPVKEAYRQAGIYSARILKGENPGDLPIILPTKFELVINLQAARRRGIEVPPSLLLRADEVIE